MDWTNAFSVPKALGSILEELGSLQDRWFYIPSATRKIDFTTPCYVLAVVESELSPEEQDELDAYPETIGLAIFLSIGQLQEIVDNLRQQCAKFSDQDLLNAIDFYWRHDAFIMHAE